MPNGIRYDDTCSADPPVEQPQASRQRMIEEAEQLVKAHMAKYDPSHDWAHVNRVRNTAMKIARSYEPQPDMLVVELAALFHDMAAKYGSTSALPSLLEPFFLSATTTTALAPEQQALILRVIPAVSWTAEKKLRATGEWSEWHENSVELHCVQDADRLDAIGAVGVLRCAAFSGAKGRTLVAEEGRSDTAEDHFEEKLLLIKDRMKTTMGKDEAERRHQTMVVFIEGLKQERALHR